MANASALFQRGVGRGVWRGAKLLALAALLVIGALLYLGIPRNAAGMAAKGVCSAAFVAGRPWQNLMAQDVLPASPVLRLISIHVDEPARAVTAKFAGLFARHAMLLPDRGCVLDVGGGRGAVAIPLPVSPVATAAMANSAVANPATANAAKPWPAGDAPLAASQWGPGVDAPALQKVVDQAFAGAGDPAATNARGVAVIHKGRLLVLQMAPGFSAQTPLHGWSMTKTVTGMLVHKLAVDEMDNNAPLPLDANVVDAFPKGREPTWLAAWRNDARKTIKVSDLLYMRDGLASTAVMETDTNGNWVGSSYLWASVGDWGRLGQLMLNDGVWGGTQVLPTGWLKRAATQSTPDGDGRGYGAQTWRIGDPDAGRCTDVGKGGSVPADTLAMSGHWGHWGQIVAMVPSREAVIVRMGWTFKRGQFDDCGFVADVLKALPK